MTEVRHLRSGGLQRRSNGAAAGSARHTASQQLWALWETALDSLLVVDDDRRYVRINAAAADLLGAPAEEVLGRRIEDFTAPENWPLLASLWADFETEGSQYGAYEVLRPDGSRTMAEYRATWWFGPGQHLIAARDMGARPTDLSELRDHSPILTRREREVLQLAADGRALAQIAAQLYVSPGTVRSHLQRIHRKLGVRDRASAVAVALRLGLID